MNIAIRIPLLGWLARCAWAGVVTVFATVLVLPAAYAAPPAQRKFDTSEAGVSAMVEALRANDEAALRAILGPSSGRLIHSGDSVEDLQGRDSFLKAYDEGNKLALEGEGKAVLLIGTDQ
jgi:hypothetical protein